MSCLQVENISCQYHGRNVLEQLSLTVADNEIVCLLGASGCGKTTLLKAIAGLMPLSHGAIRLGDKLLEGVQTSLPPEDRQIGMIFQDYALFPHLTVLQNICFGLAKLPRQTQLEQAQQSLTLVNLQGLGERYPHQLSGGQQQRVAIARALVCKPKLMLLDEPFSNIDTQVRMKLILEIRTLLKQQGISAIFVSHSKEEAFAFSDRLALFRAGRIQQVGQPELLYRQPQSRFVAEFLGGVNYLPACVVDEYQVKTPLGLIRASHPHQHNVGQDLTLMLRPQQLLLTDDENGPLCVQEQQFLGHHCRVVVSYEQLMLEASISKPLEGKRARLCIEPHPLVLFQNEP